MDPGFETKRLRFRRLTEADVDLLYELDSDPQVMRYLNGGEATPRDFIRDQILPSFMDYEPAGRLGYWAAHEARTGEFIGWFGLRSTSDPTAAELGYRLRRSAWGKGYATEGARALLQRAFQGDGHDRVSGTTYEENAASRRVMEKCGMVLVRRFRMTAGDLEGQQTFAPGMELWPGDDLEYAIDREQWLAERKMTNLA